jgi:hypothetical protein
MIRFTEYFFHLKLKGLKYSNNKKGKNVELSL